MFDIGIGNVSLAEYEYNDHNGKLNEIYYGNGHSVKYVYDTLENLSEVCYTINGIVTTVYSG